MKTFPLVPLYNILILRLESELSSDLENPTLALAPNFPLYDASNEAATENLLSVDLTVFFN